MQKSLGLALVILASSVIVSCGASSLSSSAGRQLQSIAIHAAVSNGQASFTAVGTFSAPPITVDPLPVNWTIGLLAPPPQQLSYTLTTQPYESTCSTIDPAIIQVVAFAPTSPGAPSSGSLPFSSFVTAAATNQCQ